MLNIDFITSLEACVDTRLFGESVKSCGMIPFCDAINHSCVRNSNQTLNKTQHLKGTSADGRYFTSKKFQIDYSLVYDNLDEMDYYKKELVQGLFDDDVYANNKPKNFAKYFAKNPHKGIWEVPYILDKWG